VIWIESCWLPTREGNYCQNVFSSWKRRNTPRFRTLLFGKEAVKTFFYKCSNSGVHESTPQPINGNKVVGAVMLLPKFLSRKISPEKSLDFWSQKSVLLPALRTQTKFVQKNKTEQTLRVGVCFPQPCSSAGRRFAASRSGLKY